MEKMAKSMTCQWVQDVTPSSGHHSDFPDFSLHTATLSHFLGRQKSSRQDVDDIRPRACLTFSRAELAFVELVASRKSTPGASHGVPFLETIVELQDGSIVVDR
jgi:hypothetical protein